MKRKKMNIDYFYLISCFEMQNIFFLFKILYKEVKIGMFEILKIYLNE